MPSSFALINRYIELKNIPPIIFISLNFRQAFIAENSLPHWIKGIFDGVNIYLLIDHDYPRWREIINHELFHVAVFQISKNQPVIPVWLNEAMAYYLGHNTSFQCKQLCHLLKTNYESIKNLMLTDQLMNKHENSYEIVRSFGGFFGEIYPAALIRIFFKELTLQPNFKLVFEKVFQKKIEDVIDEWYCWIQVINNKSKKNNKIIDHLGFLNSFETALAILAIIVKRDYQLMLINSWNIDLDFHNRATLSEKIDFSFDDTLKALAYYHGIHLTVIKPLSGETALEFLRSELINYRPVIISTDTYWCPWYIDYQIRHCPHYCLVNGINESAQYLTCIDKETLKTEQQVGVMPFFNYEKSFGEIYKYELLPENDFYKPEEVLGEICKRFITNIEKHVNGKRAQTTQVEDRTFASNKFSWKLQIQFNFKRISDLANILDECKSLGEEWAGYSNVNEVPLLKKLTVISNGRYKFAIALNYLAERFNKEKIAEFAKEISNIGDDWQQVRLLLVQYFQKQSKDLLDNVVSQIRQIAEREANLSFLLDEIFL